MAAAASSNKIRFKLNNQIMTIVLAIIFVTPFMLGGNRPAAWALTALVLFASGTWYFARLASVGSVTRLGFESFPILFMLFWVFALYILIQMAPIASWLPHFLTALPENIPVGNTITLTLGDTGLSLLRWLSYGLLFYLCLQIAANASRSRRFVGALFWIVVIHATYGLLLFFQFQDAILFAEKWAYAGSVTGGFVNRNSFATFLAIGAIVGATLIADRLVQFSGNRKAQPFDLLSGENSILAIMCGWLLIVVALVSTNSRMGFFAALSGSLVSVVLFVVKSGIKLTVGRIAGSAIGLLAALVLIASTYGIMLVERLTNVDADSDIRNQLYEQVWWMIEMRPLTGFGGQSFEYAYPVFHQAPVNFDVTWDKAHSTYLALWSEYGLLFGTIPMLIVGGWIVLLFLKYSRDKTSSPAVCMAIGSLIAGAVHSLVDFSLEMQGVTYLYIAVAAAGIATIPRSVTSESTSE